MKSGRKISKLKLKEQVLFFEILADLLKAGFKLQTAMEFIANLKQSNQQVMAIIQTDLANGCSFATSIAPFFHDEVVWQIELSELHGSLEQTIKVLAQSLQMRFNQQKKLKQLLQYPILLIVMLVIVGIFIRFYFLDQLLTLQGTNKPKQTLGEYWLLQIVGILGGIGVFTWFSWYRLSNMQRINLLLKVPILKNIVQYQMGYQFGYMLGLLLQAGQSYQIISSYMKKLSSRSIYFQFGTQLENACQAGDDIAEFFMNISYLPREFGLFFVRGKPNQEIGQDLGAFSKLSFQHLLKAYERLLASVQPLMFMLIAVGIIGMYAAMLLPMYQMIGELK